MAVPVLVTVGRLRPVLDDHNERIPNGEYEIVAVTSPDELEAVLSKPSVVGVLLGAGLSDDARRQYRAIVRSSGRSVPIEQHEGGYDDFVDRALTLLSTTAG